MAEDNINYPSDIKKETKVIRRKRKSGLVKLRPKITSTRSKGSSLINDHIIEATNKDNNAAIIESIDTAVRLAKNKKVLGK